MQPLCSSRAQLGHIGHSKALHACLCSRVRRFFVALRSSSAHKLACVPAEKSVRVYAPVQPPALSAPVTSALVPRGIHIHRVDPVTYGIMT